MAKKKAEEKKRKKRKIGETEELERVSLESEEQVVEEELISGSDSESEKVHEEVFFHNSSLTNARELKHSLVRTDLENIT